VHEDGALPAFPEDPPDPLATVVGGFIVRDNE
jgi:hypothetical protein